MKKFFMIMVVCFMFAIAPAASAQDSGCLSVVELYKDIVTKEMNDRILAAFYYGAMYANDLRVNNKQYIPADVTAAAQAYTNGVMSKRHN